MCTPRTRDADRPVPSAGDVSHATQSEFAWQSALSARLLILIARLWQIGPSQVLPPSCRFVPSCSAYAIDAICRYGSAKGGWLAARRLLRCNPWGGSGYDPVP